MPKELAFIDGALGGVNTMLNVVGVKENMKDRQFNRDRTLKLDEQAAEDRTFNRERTLKLDDENREDRERRNYWSEVLNEQNARLGNFNLDTAEHNLARRPIVEGQQDAQAANQLIMDGYNIRTARGAEQQRVLTESYNLLRAFNSFADGQDDIDEPAAMGALNYFLQGRINNDPATANKKITGLTPAPNGQGVMVELGVELKNGEAYSAPLTRNRSSDPADPVAIVPYNDIFALVNEVADDLQEAGFQGDMTQITKQLEEYLRVASGDRTVEQAAAELAKEERKHAREIELEGVKSGNRIKEYQSRAVTGTGNQTINTIEYFRNNLANPDGTPISVTQAVEIANLSKSDPRDAVLRVYQQLSDAQSSTMLPGRDEGRLSEQQLMEQAQTMVNQLSQSVMPTQGLTSGQGLQMPQRAQPGAQTQPGLLDELPPAAEYDGMIATDESTGVEYESINGEWVRIN